MGARCKEGGKKEEKKKNIEAGERKTENRG